MCQKFIDSAEYRHFFHRFVSLEKSTILGFSLEKLTIPQISNGAETQNFAYVHQSNLLKHCSNYGPTLV